VKGRGLSQWLCSVETVIISAIHHALVSGLITSPVDSHSSVSFTDCLNDCPFQRYESSSSQLVANGTTPVMRAERLNADWLSQRSIMLFSLPPLFYKSIFNDSLLQPFCQVYFSFKGVLIKMMF